MIKIRNYNQKNVDICIRKFRNKTGDIVKESIERLHFEKSCIDNERIRRRRKKKQREMASLKKRYGYKWVLHVDLLRD